MDLTPAVTCLQTSYGRPDLSQEAVECFVRQTYPNKTLIIVNTHPDPVWFQRNFAERNRIWVRNIRPLDRLSDVYRFALDHVESPLFCFWDDDDLFLPWHLQERVDGFLAAKRDAPDDPRPIRVGHRFAFLMVENRIRSLESNMFVAQYVYEASAMRPGAGIAVWDLDWERRWATHGRTVKVDLPARPSYVYRWATGESHISGQVDEPGQHRNYVDNIETKSKLRFSDAWDPSWRLDYAAHAEGFLAECTRSIS